LKWLYSKLGSVVNKIELFPAGKLAGRKAVKL
jgi:hypothetical protein